MASPLVAAHSVSCSTDASGLFQLLQSILREETVSFLGDAINLAILLGDHGLGALQTQVGFAKLSRREGIMSSFNWAMGKSNLFCRTLRL